MKVLQENWVIFRRKKFKDGVIDIWTGDQAHNPNEPKMKRYNLNSNATWIRLNNTKWENIKDNFKSSLVAVVAVADKNQSLVKIINKFSL